MQNFKLILTILKKSKNLLKLLQPLNLPNHHKNFSQNNKKIPTTKTENNKKKSKKSLCISNKRNLSLKLSQSIKTITVSSIERNFHYLPYLFLKIHLYFHF
jgi:hypothetical protein